MAPRPSEGGRGVRSDRSLIRAVGISRITADLNGADFDITTAKPLSENMAVCFIGTMKKAPFDVPYETGARWLKPAGNPNGRSNADVVFPWLNGDDITGRLRHRWIIDFGERSETEAAGYVAPFAHVLTQVKPNRITSGSPSERNYWWRLARRAPAMLAAISRFPRFLVTPRVAKHRLLFWLASPAVPDGQLVVIACDEDTTFGILHSRFHEAWALRLCTWLGVGNDPRYTPTTTFETFPFPPGLTPNIPAADYAENPHAHAIAAAARALAEARDRWLNPPDLMERVPEVVPGFPDRILPRDDKAAAVLKTRTLTNLYNTRGKPEGAWLDGLHAALDAAVAAAYGWPSDISDEDALARLLALNVERARPEDACRPKVA